MKILHCDRGSVPRHNISLMLGSDGMHVDSCDTAEECIAYASAYDYDIVLLDPDLEDSNPVDLTVLHDLRLRVQTPVLILSARHEIQDRVRALRAGADDYMVKPFHKDELVARMKAIVRRMSGYAQSAVQIGNLEVDLDRQKVSVRGQHVHLTGKEYQMLELLVLRKGMPLTKDAFLNYIYCGRDEPQAKIIDVFACKLRKKLADANGGEHYIETIWGRGYALKAPVSENEVAA